jgi:23S rRNA pseudouridine2605 synthase
VTPVVPARRVWCVSRSCWPVPASVRVANLGDRADPSVDDIRLDGERLLREKPSYWIINKPRGVVTTVRDDEGRRTVMDLLPRNVGRLFPVGRLDRETSGLLLLTNDGDTAHALLHPSLGNEREYKVNVKGEIDERAVGRLKKGVPLEDGRTAPGRVSGVRFDSDSETSSFSLVLVEGRKRQIRRSLLILGFPVRRLVRVRMGPLRLGRLAVGEARPLRAEERRSLLTHVAKLRSRDEGSGKPARKQTAQRVQRRVRSRKGTRR